MGIKSRKMKWVTLGETRNTHTITKRKTPLVRPRYRWEENNKMDLREDGFGDVD
jgi:hypothetical protein